MSTNWTRLYGPTVTPDSSEHTILTAPATVAYVLTKFTISNVSTSAVLATIKITPSGGSKVQVFQKSIPGYPVQGGVVEVVELEGAILNAGDSVQFTDATGGALVPFISGVAYTP